MEVQVQLSESKSVVNRDLIGKLSLETSLIQSPNQYQWRDVWCCILFGLVWIAVAIISGYSFALGNPSNLLNPFDSVGYQCGISPGYEAYPYIYYNSQIQSQFACINTCPSTKKAVANSLCYYNNSNMNCSNFGVYATQRIVRICQPTTSPITFQYDIGLQIEQQWISDLSTTYIASISIFFYAVILSIIILILMRWIPKIVIYSSLILHLVLFIGFGILVFLMANSLAFAQKITDYYQLLSPFYLRIIAYICWGIALISLLLILCNIQKIKIAIIILQLSAKFEIVNKPSLLMVPILITIVFFMVLTYFIALVLYIFSSGAIKACTDFPYGCVNWNFTLRRYFGFTMLGFVWSSLLVIACNKFLIASVVAEWYFRRKTQKTILISLKKMVYQLGSISLGSLVLGFLSIFEFFIQFLGCINFKRKEGPNNISCCTRFYYGICNCFHTVIQNFLKLVTSNAYIVMAITRSSFCTSAKDSFALIKKYKKSYLITHDLSRITTFFIKLLVAISGSMTGYGIITTIPYFSDNIYEPTFPTFVFFIIGLVVSSVFVDTLTNSSDSMLICSFFNKELELINKSVIQQTQQTKKVEMHINHVYDIINNESN